MVNIKRVSRVSSRSNTRRKQRSLRRKMFGKSKSRSLTSMQRRKADEALGMIIYLDRQAVNRAKKASYDLIATKKRKLSADKKKYARKKRKLVSKSKSGRSLSLNERSRARKMKLILRSKTRKTKTSILKEKSRLKSKLNKLKKKKAKAIKAAKKKAHSKACKGKVSKTLSKELHKLAPSGAQIDKLTKRSYKKLRKDVNGKLTEIGKYRTKCNKHVRS